MTNKVSETKLTQFLEQQQVAFRLLHHQTPATTIEDAANQRGITTNQMVKCILLRDMGGKLALACAPGDKSVDPKKVRTFLQWRRMTCVNMKDVESITGYQIGTVTPLLLKTSMPVIFDHQILEQPVVTISSGSSMAGIALQTHDLIQLCCPSFAHIQREE